MPRHNGHRLARRKRSFNHPALLFVRPVSPDALNRLKRPFHQALSAAQLHASPQEKLLFSNTLCTGGQKTTLTLIARAHGLNANQVFKWRRAFERGELVDSAASSTALLPVTIAAPREREEPDAEQQPRTSGSIHIEFPGRATISVEIGADAALLRSILESLRK